MKHICIILEVRWNWQIRITSFHIVRFLLFHCLHMDKLDERVVKTTWPTMPKSGHSMSSIFKCKELWRTFRVQYRNILWFMIVITVLYLVHVIKQYVKIRITISMRSIFTIKKIPMPYPLHSRDLFEKQYSI